VIWIVTVLAPLLGYRAYWLLFVVSIQPSEASDHVCHVVLTLNLSTRSRARVSQIPGWVGYIGYQFAAPLYAQQMAKQQQQQQRVPAQATPAAEVEKEELSKTQAKKEARRKAAEKAQRNVRR
jgi:hypothetical protein